MHHPPKPGRKTEAMTRWLRADKQVAPEVHAGILLLRHPRPFVAARDGQYVGFDYAAGALLDDSGRQQQPQVRSPLPPLVRSPCKHSTYDPSSRRALGRAFACWISASSSLSLRVRASAPRPVREDAEAICLGVS